MAVYLVDLPRGGDLDIVQHLALHGESHLPDVHVALHIVQGQCRRFVAKAGYGQQIVAFVQVAQTECTVGIGRNACDQS